MMNLTRAILVALCSAALLVGAMAHAQDDRSKWPRSTVIGTASQGGTYFIYGSGLANLIAESLKINAGAEVTGGPVQNATLVQTGEHQLGLVTMGPAYAAWTGKSALAPGLEHKDLRAVFPMYQTSFQIVALRRSGIETVADLDGKTVGVGPAGGTADMYFPQFFETLGVKVRKRNGGAADLVSQLQDGLIDAFAFAAGIPIAAFSQIEAQVPVRIFSLDQSQVARITEKFPELSPATIPAGTYQSLTADIPAISIWNFAVTHKDMPDSLVYAVTRTVMENPGRMQQIHEAAQETRPQNVGANSFLPYHPGAVRWFEENGHEIPAKLKP
jgi:uncharacterized protein